MRFVYLLTGVGLCAWTVGGCMGDGDSNQVPYVVSPQDTTLDAASGQQDTTGSQTTPVSTQGADTSSPATSQPSTQQTSCDALGDCWGTCWACAIDGPCAALQLACDQDAGCSALADCVAKCPDQGWWDCYVACGGDTGSLAEQKLQALWDCIYCDACASSCTGLGHDCSEYNTPVDTGSSTPIDTTNLTWRQARLTWYESYPDPNSPECIEYNGCTWAGYLAYFPGEQKSEAWIQSHNIAAVHEMDWDTYKGKTLRLRKGSQTIDVVVYDMCAESDCNGCCTANRNQAGFLIDLEIHTYNRFTGEDGIIEWACLDC